MPAHENIRAKRAEMELSLADLEKVIQRWLPGFTRNTIYRIEHGLRKVDADEIPPLARALKCLPQDLLDSMPD